MADARISTPTLPVQKVSVSGISASFTDLTPTSTAPTTGLIYKRSQSGTGAFVQSPSLVTMIPFSSASSGTNIRMRVYKWSAYTATGGTKWYIPTAIMQGTLTFRTGGTVPSFTPDGTALYLFNGISLTAIAPSVNVYNPSVLATTNDLAVAVSVDPLGAERITVDFTGSGSPTMGVFWSTV